jgi:membrane protein
MTLKEFIKSKRLSRKTAIYLKRLKIPSFEGLSVYDFLELYVVGLIKGTLTSRAGSIAFSFFMAVFPFTLFVLTLIPYIPIDGFQEYLFKTLQDILPGNSFDAVDSTITDIINIKHGGLMSTSFIMAAIFATNGINAVITGLTNTTHELEIRSIINQYITSFYLTFLLTLLFIIAVGIIIISEIILSNFSQVELIGNYIPMLIDIGRYIILSILLFLSVSLIFYKGPKSNQQWKFVSPGAFLTTVLIFLISYLFGLYVSNFGQYNKLYGSIGTLLVIMFWMYLNSIILLIGFDLNASIWKLKKMAKNKAEDRKRKKHNHHRLGIIDRIEKFMDHH